MLCPLLGQPKPMTGWFQNTKASLPPLRTTLRTIPGGSMVKNPPAKQETWVQSLHWEDPLEKEITTHSSIFAWDRGAWWATVHGVARVRHNWATEQQQQLPALEHLIRSADASVQQLPLPILPHSLTYKSLPSKPPVCKFSSPSVFLRTQPMTKHTWLKCIYFPVFPGRESRLINVALTWYSIMFCCSWEKICSLWRWGVGRRMEKENRAVRDQACFRTCKFPM